MSAPISLWRCETCDKWSHARVKPKFHHRFILDEEGTEPPAEFISHEPPSYSSGYDESHNPGGWWVKCGPFVEFHAERVSP